MVENRKLSEILRDDPNLDSETFKPVKHLVVNDYTHFLLEFNVCISETTFNKFGGIHYYTKEMLSDLFMLDFGFHPDTDILNKLFVDLSIFNLNLRRIDNDLYPHIDLASQEKWFDLTLNQNP